MNKFLELLNEVKKLNLPKDKFAVFGSGPLAIRGIRDSRDIDLIVKPDLWEDLTKKYPITDKYGGIIEIGEIEIFKDFKPWFDDVEILIDDSDIFEGIRFVKLNYVLEWKKSFNREKDQNDIKIIKEFLTKSPDIN